MQKAFKINIALWCNGNTEASGALVLGSNPSRATKNRICNRANTVLTEFLNNKEF